jgi:4-hydroxyphenylacetate 3-monooxygenase
VERRRALEAWAGLHFGFMGRSPDHVARPRRRAHPGG